MKFENIVKIWLIWISQIRLTCNYPSLIWRESIPQSGKCHWKCQTWKVSSGSAPTTLSNRVTRSSLSRSFVSSGFWRDEIVSSGCDGSSAVFSSSSSCSRNESKFGNQYVWLQAVDKSDFQSCEWRQRFTWAANG